MKNITLPISFDDVPYYRNSFRGDLIITHGVIYYFPHANTLTQEGKREYPLTSHIGLIALPIDLIWLELRSTTNQSRLRQEGLWRDSDSSQMLQARLDAYIAERKRQPSQLVEYEYKLPKPMRFMQAAIKNLSTKGGLVFDTKYEHHDFKIGFHRKRILREALWIGGFRRSASHLTSHSR